MRADVTEATHWALLPQPMTQEQVADLVARTRRSMRPRRPPKRRFSLRCSHGHLRVRGKGGRYQCPTCKSEWDRAHRRPQAKA